MRTEWVTYAVDHLFPDQSPLLLSDSDQLFARQMRDYSIVLFMDRLEFATNPRCFTARPLIYFIGN